MKFNSFTRIAGLISIMLIGWLCMPSFAMPDKPDAKFATVVLDAIPALVQTDFAVPSVLAESLSKNQTLNMPVTVGVVIAASHDPDMVYSGVSLLTAGVSDKVTTTILTTANTETANGKFTGDDFTCSIITI